MATPADRLAEDPSPRPPETPPETPPKTHPKTGERRRTRRPLRIDALPRALLERIRAERAQGGTWSDLERDSPQWPEWEQASPEVLAQFPGRRLPHTSLQRWHDLRVDQLLRERHDRLITAQMFAGRLAAPGIANLGVAVCNALSESVLRLSLEGGDEQHIRDELCRLARVVATVERTEIARRRQELESRKFTAAIQEKLARLINRNAAAGREHQAFVEELKKSPAFTSCFQDAAGRAAAKPVSGAGKKAAKAGEKPHDHCEPAPGGPPADPLPPPASSRQTGPESGVPGKPAFGFAGVESGFLSTPPFGFAGVESGRQPDHRNIEDAVMGFLWARVAEQMAELAAPDSPAGPAAANAKRKPDEQDDGDEEYDDDEESDDDDEHDDEEECDGDEDDEEQQREEGEDDGDGADEPDQQDEEDEEQQDEGAEDGGDGDDEPGQQDEEAQPEQQDGQG